MPWMLTHSYDTVLEEKNHDSPPETIAAATVLRRPYWGGSPLRGDAPGTGSEGGPCVPELHSVMTRCSTGDRRQPGRALEPSKTEVKFEISCGLFCRK